MARNWFEYMDVRVTPPGLRAKARLNNYRAALACASTVAHVFQAAHDICRADKRS